eukprot:72767-Rhodomonas_salina.1
MPLLAPLSTCSKPLSSSLLLASRSRFADSRVRACLVSAQTGMQRCGHAIASAPGTGAFVTGLLRSTRTRKDRM